MNEKNIEMIKGQLMSLGLPTQIEFDLRSNICLQQDKFQVAHQLVKEEDIMNCVFYFERKENEYGCSYYEACLRKKILIPEMVVNEIDVKELDDNMSAIDWQNIFNNHGKDFRFEAIESIVSDHAKLSASAEGLEIACRLKIKYWIDTSLVFLIPNVSALRNQYEISQRFYFFHDEEQISLDEAYRFLSHRWREKQLNAKKKQPENNDGHETTSGGAATKDIRLLNKKKNNKNRQHK